MLGTEQTRTSAASSGGAQVSIGTNSVLAPEPSVPEAGSPSCGGPGCGRWSRVLRAGISGCAAQGRMGRWKVPAVGLWGCSLCEPGFADAIVLVATLPGRCHILEPMAGADCAAKCVKCVCIVRATGGTCEGRA